MNTLTPLEQETKRMVELSGIKPNKLFLISYDKNNPGDSNENLNAVLDFIDFIEGKPERRPVTTTIIFSCDKTMEFIRPTAKVKLANIHCIIFELYKDDSDAEIFAQYNETLDNNFQELLQKRS